MPIHILYDGGSFSCRLSRNETNFDRVGTNYKNDPGIDSNVKSTEQVTKRVLNCNASRGIQSPCAELAAQYSHSTPTPTAVRPSPPASP